MESLVLRLIINILILLLLIRLMQPVFRGAGRLLRRFFSPEPIRNGKPGHTGKYSQLTPYEIEDAEYDEVRGKGK